MYTFKFLAAEPSFTQKIMLPMSQCILNRLKQNFFDQSAP